MKTIHVWVDEVGTINYKDTQQPFFGFGSVTSTAPLAALSSAAEALRYELELKGLNMSKGFHCRDDNHDTRNEFFPLVRKHVEDFNATLLLKANAYDYVRARGDMHLYRQAWYLHAKFLVGRYAGADRIHLIVAKFDTVKRRHEAESAIHEVCQQFNTEIRVSVWDAHSTIGLQAADYCLWAAQRKAVRGQSAWYDNHVAPIARPTYFPWGETKRRDPKEVPPLKLTPAIQ